MHEPMGTFHTQTTTFSKGGLGHLVLKKSSTAVPLQTLTRKAEELGQADQSHWDQ